MSGSFKAQRIAKLHAQASDIQTETEYLKSDPGVELDAAVQAYMDNSVRTITYSQAMEKVLTDPAHADLARRYRASFPNAHLKGVKD